MVMLILGAVLTLVGAGGAIRACVAPAEQSILPLAGFAGLAFAAGIVLMALGGAKHGYHYRPPGAPPGDADPDKVSDPNP